MTTLDELLHPITREQFDADYNDRKPLHIPAGEGAPKRALLDWARFNALLDQSSIWTAQSLKLVFNGQPIPAGQYCIETQSQSGPTVRPSPAKVQTLLAMGASLIAGDVQELTPELRGLSHRLARDFAGLVGANVYCSFGGVQAFDSHFDLHHVFAVQLEGEKTWRLYENRADAPVSFPVDEAESRRWFAQTRGKLMTEIRMRPGDVLYLPRGWYHDAMATEGASLHVTFSVTPLYGRIMFRLLESAAMQDPAFRAWLAPGDTDGDRLGKQLADLGRRLAELSALPAFRDEVLMAQERLVPRPASYALPARTSLTLLRATGLTPPRGTGPAQIAIEWALGQPQFAMEDVIAQFDFVPVSALNEAFEAAIGRGVFKPL
ncbi:MAG: cupin domain-containing protein [Brevundimonas sp.]|uniref:JmjC domain-containing protein n=1 Tax=Brevundimonas sp. TaxID=1871086 RepID=UPI0027201C7B|nr:cupin domain-containing protein [Brevundimonas sp.]MDO9076703.1 cupin domain-containing protein [Brevundimonas sp.]MDP3080552.1 cupin domain-containing protein [Brevundimonas sp.]MDZ4062879.1 cupin domain-containing protein [Brevundimonas sp.]